LFFQRVIEKQGVLASAAIVAIDSQSESYFSSRYPGKKVIRLPIGVDMGTFRPGDRDAAREDLNLPLDGDLVLVAARPAPEKRLDLAGRTLGCLARDRPGLHFAFAGAVRRNPAVDQLAREIPQERFHFLGILKHDRMAVAYRASNILLLTSAEEQLPNVAIEALACGIPVVSTRVGDMQELLNDPLTGECEDPDPSRLAAAVIRGLENARDSGGSGVEVRRISVEPFSWSRIGAEISSLCETV